MQKYLHYFKNGKQLNITTRGISSVNRKFMKKEIQQGFIFGVLLIHTKFTIPIPFLQINHVQNGSYESSKPHEDLCNHSAP